MKVVMFLIFIFTIIAVDRILQNRTRKKAIDNPEFIENLQKEHNSLSSGRLIYLAFYIIMVFVTMILTHGELGFTTEPDYESIRNVEVDERITLVGDLTEIFVTRAKSDTNGWIWGGFFVLTGLLGLKFKMSIISARLPINSYGSIQFVINSICIIAGIFLILRVQIYEFFSWPIDIGYSYFDLLESLGLSEQ